MVANRYERVDVVRSDVSGNEDDEGAYLTLIARSQGGSHGWLTVLSPAELASVVQQGTKLLSKLKPALLCTHEKVRYGHCAYLACPNYRSKCGRHSLAVTSEECNRE